MSAQLPFLDLGVGCVLSANPDGSNLKTIVNEGRRLPDGLMVDVAAGHIYWNNMGNPEQNDGSILRSDLDGKNMITIVPPGGTLRPSSSSWRRRAASSTGRPRGHASDAGKPGPAARHADSPSDTVIARNVNGRTHSVSTLPTLDGQFLVLCGERP